MNNSIKKTHTHITQTRDYDKRWRKMMQKISEGKRKIYQTNFHKRQKGKKVLIENF